MHNFSKLKMSIYSLAAMMAIVLPGCGKPVVVEQAKAPRPVSVIALKSGVPKTTRQMSSPVSSWKTEQIGFEIAGRIDWVLEPGAEIEGRVFDSDGNIVTPGTALAQVDTERFELALEAAKAQVLVTELQRDSTQVSLDSGIPADIEAAEADLELAQVEYKRNERLVAQKATAQADLDKSAAGLRTSRARIATLDAQTKQTQAQLESAVASIRQAEQALKDAELNLADTTLYSSFRGQVADVHVVPGSVVAQGSPVLTVQMMDPIKVEMELSAEQSRTIRKRHHLPVYITMPDGTEKRQEGFVYSVSPTADTSTRTFTLTLLVLNRKIEEPIPKEYQDKKLARTADVWRLDFDFLPDTTAGTYYIDKKAICQDEQGHYVWKCLNTKVRQPLPELLQVTKMRITLGDRSIPFLGNWLFQAITIDDPNFDPTSDFFVGELVVESGSPNDWEGNQVLVDRGEQWMLRPGDLVEVDISQADTTSGFYVPMEAIYEESGKTYVFVASTSNNATTAKRIPVTVEPSDGLEIGTVRQVNPESPGQLVDGMQIIVGGVHFLHDGDSVNITERK